MGAHSLDQSGRASHGYAHTRWEYRRRFLRFLLRTLGTRLFRVERVDGLENFPRQGPAVLMMNHIAFVDPVVMVHICPRLIVPMAKIEVYEYPLVGIFPRLWGVIPVRRGEVDRAAVRTALQVLKAGEVLLVAPEGTRNPQMQRGLVGVAYLASRADVPVIPVAIQNTEGFPSLPFLPRWKAPGAHITFGRPFRYRVEYRRASREDLRRMTDEAMYVLAGMLPEKHRGVYGDLAQHAARETIEWL